MPDIIKPIDKPKMAVQVERRCSHTVCLNNLDDESGDPTLKYGVTLTVWDEEQDADGNRVGERIRVPDKQIPMIEVMKREFTVAGVTLPGALILALFNEVIDAYKGD